ncbi:chaoptin [Toxorhynchites rutilus septentrionalis]|uniref:chaoptin n=1 Tax=Toxorhynchites rutilus septentrionalis TaxID=329112 RepID=UPI00247ACC61|nr:chaoptin [Toxorhynchites rutilus septentrionalis]XP_055640651.1 chaoptin [Toxorhynchites rutilus septentrionalis]XP_055640652.1 chaoptin [Toxorhynchites rutilus septentrionalis]XP_055640653.1 chaoptin [Toxorhynchites rutilus septentrionalis]XP_055640654.1 chaoptin [Toxorhynchites rutilus septentrionalis]XP_055640655.1 chaoptin [Toxorhynchites rutilus septentrionalis]XP_055640656.1 chaoptin [Toxorhynchites rutilus septentrionalis]XP_055640657.1 chaoptin [Toxorhynchites rutilus septentriona
MKLKRIGVLLSASIITWLSVLQITDAEYIPPGPKYTCPEKAKIIYPCVCTRGTDDGIYVNCENSNLASLSVAFINLASLNVPVEELHIKRCKIKNLFGTLLHKLSVKRLFVLDTPIISISDHVFYGINDTLLELHLVRSELSAFPTDALKVLGMLKVLNIDEHRIENLPKGIFGGMGFEGTLEKFHFVNGLLADMGPDIFMSFKKIRTLDIHGNRLVTLKKGQFKGLREAEILDLSFNNLTKLDASHVSDLTKMTWINVSHNALSEITRGTFARNAVLRVLNMAFNNIKKIDANTFRGMRFLRRLHLNDNMISDVGRGTFGSVTRIGTIDLARNRIKKVDYQMFFQLNYVEVVNLAENEITEIQKDSFKDLYLTHINISHNRLETIEPKSFINCANMTVLDLSHNLIRSLPRTAFDETTYASEWILTHNLLTNMSQISLANMTGLRVLNVSYNNIVDIPKNTFPKLYELHTIDASHNSISHIYNAVFQNLFSLRVLNLSHNAMEKIGPSTFGTLPTLLEMDLSHNNLKDITRGALAKTTGLRYLTMTNNKLEKIFQIPISLNHLNLAHNDIKEVPEKTWPTMNSLLSLDLSHNKLQNNLQRGSFAGLLTMQTLNLESNEISEVPRDSLADLGTLQYLHLTNNSITDLPKNAFGNLPILFEVQIMNNGLHNISAKAFDGLLQLLTLNMSNNLLRTIPNDAFAGLVSLRKLDVSRNLMSSLDNKTNGLLDGCLSLEEIDISHNRFNFITKKTFPSNQYIPYRLKKIDLSFNAMSIITHDLKFGTKTVTHLNISHNNIKDIRKGVLGNLTSLRTLDLSYNELVRLESDVFNMQENFSELILHHNRIMNVSYDSLLKLNKLTLLDLRANDIARFDTELVTKMKLSNLSVFFEGNPLLCDCYTRPLYNYLRTLPSVTPEYQNIRCSEPAATSGMAFYNVSDELLTCVPASDNEIYKLLPDLRFREVSYFRGHLVAHWFVTATKDIGDFYVYIRDQRNNILFDRIVSYNNRRTEINGDEIVGSSSSSLELCVLAKSSSEEINFLESQCVRLPENLNAVKQKYNANHNYKLPLSLTRSLNARSSSCDNSRNSVVWLVTVMVAVLNWHRWNGS